MYNIKLVEKRVGIPSVTIRAWENRYGVIKPERTDSGHRLYSEEDIEDLMWLKIQTDEKGMSISQAAKLLLQRKERKENPVADVTVHQQTYEELSDRLYLALIQFQTEKANEVLDFGLSMFQHEELFTNVMTEVLRRVGAEWDQGIRTIAQEHFVTQFVLQRLSQFFRVFPIDSALPKVIALCPTGEFHQVGLMMFSLFLRKKGMEVIYLGSDMPFDGVEEMVRQQRISLICISSTRSEYVAPVYDFVRELQVKNPRLKFAMGGYGFMEMPEDLQRWKIGKTLDEWRNWFQVEFQFRN